MINNNIAIILVAPQLGENIGASARAMKNFGLRDLRIVAPRYGGPNKKQKSMVLLSRSKSVVQSLGQLGLGDHVARAQHQVLENAARTWSIPPACLYVTRCSRVSSTTGPQRSCADAQPPARTQQRLHACQHLLEFERLADVVVGAGLQALDLAASARARSAPGSEGALGRAQLADDFEPGNFGRPRSTIARSTGNSRPRYRPSSPSAAESTLKPAAASRATAARAVAVRLRPPAASLHAPGGGIDAHVDMCLPVSSDSRRST